MKHKSKAELLYLEAFTILFIVNKLVEPNLLNATDRLVKIQRRAQTRCSRRFYSWQKGK